MGRAPLAKLNKAAVAMYPLDQLTLNRTTSLNDPVCQGYSPLSIEGGDQPAYDRLCWQQLVADASSRRTCQHLACAT
jgi:hypothetical protein